VLPPARAPGSYRIELVCLGNICRSPTAHVVLEERLADAGLDRVEVSSSGTGDWHVGHPMDRRAAATLTAAGYDATRHRARQHDPAEGVDLVLAMDEANLREISRRSQHDLLNPSQGGRTDRIRKFRDFDPAGHSAEGESDVPDPYYGGDDGFEEVLTMVERTASAIVDALRHERPWLP
jgi:protein-tyrosine phosphatase